MGARVTTGALAAHEGLARRPGHGATGVAGSVGEGALDATRSASCSSSSQPASAVSFLFTM